VKALRRLLPRAKASIVINAAAARRRSDSADDLRAERLYDLGAGYLYLDPILKGGYDPELVSELQRRGMYPAVAEGDFEAIRGDLDAIGINYYFDQTVWHEGSHPNDVRVGDGPGAQRTAMGWTIYPEGLFELLEKFSGRYPNIPLFVTENGSAWEDEVVGDQVSDPQRTAYLEAHLAQAARAVAAGIPLKGYYAWSLLDNYEWAFGYGKRFGIVHVDFETQKRTIKASGHRYAQIIARRGF
jgi:beta-glucosidase